jgi:prevent-host-death family protein
MITVGIIEAESQFPSLLEQVEHGELITITKQGIPVAKIIPVTGQSNSDLPQVIKDLKEFRKGRRLDGLSIRQMIEEGRQ